MEMEKITNVYMRVKFAEGKPVINENTMNALRKLNKAWANNMYFFIRVTPEMWEILATRERSISGMKQIARGDWIIYKKYILGELPKDITERMENDMKLSVEMSKNTGETATGTVEEIVFDTQATEEQDVQTPESVAAESEPQNNALGTVFGNDGALLKDIEKPDEKLVGVDVDLSGASNGQGSVDLTKQTKKAQKTVLEQDGEAAHKAMTSTVNNSTPAPEVYNDTEQIMLNKLKNDPMYMSHKNPDGSFTILEKKVNGWKYEIHAGMNMDTTIGHTKVSIWLVIKRKQEEKIFNEKSFSLSSIRRGGTQFVEHVMNYDVKFSIADANVANGRLFVLIMENKMKVHKIELYMNYGEIMKYFQDYIVNGIKERHQNPGDSAHCHPEIYLEEVSNGPRSKGKHINVGIWDKEFRSIYQKLIDDGKVKTKESEFLKQAKMHYDLLPDSGRGGGQHTPGSLRSAKYGKSDVDRIQRFNFDKGKLQELWNTEVKYRLLGYGKYC